MNQIRRLLLFLGGMIPFSLSSFRCGLRVFRWHPKFWLSLRFILRIRWIVQRTRCFRFSKLLINPRVRVRCLRVIQWLLRWRLYIRRWILPRIIFCRWVSCVPLISERLKQPSWRPISRWFLSIKSLRQPIIIWFSSRDLRSWWWICCRPWRLIRWGRRSKAWRGRAFLQLIWLRLSRIWSWLRRRQHRLISVRQSLRLRRRLRFIGRAQRPCWPRFIIIILWVFILRRRCSRCVRCPWWRL